MEQNKIRVRRASTRSARNNPNGPHNWVVEWAVRPGVTRVFVYSEFSWAIRNAQRIARADRISIFGLRGFHITLEGPVFP